jgi:hypothetical protein
VAVGRFAQINGPTLNAYNSDSVPCARFRTDDRDPSASAQDKINLNVGLVAFVSKIFSRIVGALRIITVRLVHPHLPGVFFSKKVINNLMIA